MAEYRLTHTDIVVRTADEAYIPNDPQNFDRMVYENWLANGGKPDPSTDVVAKDGPFSATR